MTIAEVRRMVAPARAYDKASAEARAATTRFWAAEYYANRARAERLIIRRVLAGTRERVS